MGEGMGNGNPPISILLLSLNPEVAEPTAGVRGLLADVKPGNHRLAVLWHHNVSTNLAPIVWLFWNGHQREVNVAATSQTRLNHGGIFSWCGVPFESKTDSQEIARAGLDDRRIEPHAVTLFEPQGVMPQSIVPCQHTSGIFRKH